MNGILDKLKNKRNALVKKFEEGLNKANDIFERAENVTVFNLCSKRRNFSIAL